MVSYNKLWKLLIDKEMKKKDLGDIAGVSANTLARMGKNELVSMDVLVRICRALNSDIGDVMEFRNLHWNDYYYRNASICLWNGDYIW